MTVTGSGRLPGSRVWLLGLVELAALAPLTAPLVVGLPAKVLRLAPAGESDAVLGLVLSVGFAAALVANPLAGLWSDRLRWRWGRRRPFLLGGALLALVGAAGMAGSDRVATLAAGWVVVQVGCNAVLAALAALLADQVTEPQRAAAAGVFGACTFLAILPAAVLAVAFPDDLVLLLVAMPVLSVLVVGAACLVLPDPVPPSRPVTPAREPGAAPPVQFWLLWLQRFVMQLGYTSVASFGLYYTMQRLAMPQAASTRLVSAATGVTALLAIAGALACGRLSGRRGRYGPALLGCVALMSAGLVLRAVSADLAAYWTATLACGLALGAYYAVDLALALRVVPAGAAGRYLGLFNAAKTLPQSVAPALAPVLLGLGRTDPVGGGASNYLALYLAAAAAVAASALTLRPLRSALNRPEPQPEVLLPAQQSADG